MADELQIIRDCYEFTLELARRVEKFPRHQRIGLGSEMTEQARDVLRRLVKAKYSSTDRASLLAEANLEIELLRFSLRLAFDLKALPTAGHHHLLQLAQRIGAQTGGWLKATRGKETS